MSKTFQPGDVVATSGIYECQHGDGQYQQMALLRNTKFPECRVCGKEVEYRLVHAAPSIYEDPDFAP